MANLECSNCDELVQRAKQNADALGCLYDKYYDRIYRFVLLRLYYAQRAEDITSEIFLTVAKKIKNFKGTTEQDFKSWLYSIASNHANSHIRKHLRRKQLFENYIQADQDSRKVHSGDNNHSPDWPAVYLAIARLNPLHQTIVTLRFFENMEFEEIAKIVNKKPATVRVIVHRIIRKLRNNLTDSLNGGFNDE